MRVFSVHLNKPTGCRRAAFNHNKNESKKTHPDFNRITCRRNHKMQPNVSISLKKGFVKIKRIHRKKSNNLLKIENIKCEVVHPRHRSECSSTIRNIHAHPVCLTYFPFTLSLSWTFCARTFVSSDFIWTHTHRIICMCTHTHVQRTYVNKSDVWNRKEGVKNCYSCYVRAFVGFILSIAGLFFFCCLGE